MSTAADIVRMQADLLDAFRTPDPNMRGYVYAVQTAGRQRVEYPVSVIGRIVDLLMFGPSGTVGEEIRRMFVSLPGDGAPAWAAPYSAAAIVGNGLSTARAFRVQENMTDAVLRRCDALPADTRFGLDEDQITPPRPSGFAYFCQPVPHRARPSADPADDPGIGLITWTAVVDMDEHDEPRELAWVVVVWDDAVRTKIVGEVGRKLHAGLRDQPRSKQRFVPVTAFAVTPGHYLGGAVLPVRQLGEPHMRSPVHTVGALWQLLGETIPAASGDHAERVEHGTEELDKRTRRQARMAGLDEPSEVTTVVLRREHKPVQHPGTGRKPEYRVEIDAYEAWRWIGSERLGTRKRVRRTIRKHWSSKDESLPVRQRTVVSELRR